MFPPSFKGEEDTGGGVHLRFIICWRGCSGSDGRVRFLDKARFFASLRMTEWWAQNDTGREKEGGFTPSGTLTG